MAKSYLDKDGLLYFWQKIKTYFTGTSTPLMDGTAATGDSTKFARENHVHPSDTTKVDKVSGKGLSTNDYTTAEKNKLAGIAAGAEVNQNAFSNVKVGSTTVAADGKTDTLELVAGSNVTLTPDATNDKVTIAASHPTYTAFTGKPTANQTPAFGGTFTIQQISQSASGQVSGTDRTVTIPSTVASETAAGLMSADTYNELAVLVAIERSLSIDGVCIHDVDDPADVVHYGTCSTAAGTAAKVVDCPGLGISAAPGAIVYVKFTVTNTAAVANLTLNVNGSGAKSIKYRNANLPSAGTLAANRIYCFVYDGTNWQIVGDLDTNTTYSTLTQALVDTGTETTGKLVSAKIVHDTAQNAATALANELEFDVATGSTSNTADVLLIRDADGDGADADDTDLGSFTVAGGTNVTVTADATNKKVTIAAKDTTYAAGTGISISNSTIGHSNSVTAQTSAAMRQIAFDAQGHITSGAATTAANVVSLLGTTAVNRATADASGNNIASTYIKASAKGAASGVCPLNASSKIDATYLPSYVDDVIEAYARSGQTALSQNWLATGSASGTVITPETGKIYVLMADSGDYAANTQFRWSGSAYVKMADGGVSSITNAEIDTIVAA